MHRSLPWIVVVVTATMVRADDARLPVTEVIVLEGSPPPPAVAARPLVRHQPRGEIDNIFLRVAPPYSDAAIETDTWTTAWMLLDIDARGAVERVKFLRRPGLDLEPIAVATALALRFEPARDADGTPVRSWIVWPIEWPSYWWLVSRTGLASGIPDTRHIPCRGQGPLNLGSVHPTYRDCSRPDFAAATVEAWHRAPRPRTPPRRR